MPSKKRKSSIVFPKKKEKKEKEKSNDRCGDKAL
jgi:hypothetical protein